MQRWLAAEAGAEIALSHVDRIEAGCETLPSFPGRGSPGSGALRSITSEKRDTIFCRVGRSTVTIVAVYHRGRSVPA